MNESCPMGLFICKLGVMVIRNLVDDYIDVLWVGLNQSQINEIMRELRLYTDTAEVAIIKEKNRYIKDLLNQKYMEIECIQSQIPDRGVATNYILYTYDPQARCGESII